VVAQNADASQRLRAATGVVSGGLHVVPPTEGQLIRFSYDSTSPQLAATIANGIADSFINAALQRRYEASAYARNFLERQIAKTRGDLERSERALVGYAQAQGIINTASDGKQTGGDTGSLQGESLVALNKALADATARRVAAEGAYRQGLATGPTSDVTNSTLTLRSQRATLEADYQQKRTFMKPEHPEMLSLRSQIDELDKQIARESAQMSSGRNNTLLADYRAAVSAERALQGRVAGLKGACSTSGAAASSIISCSARWTPTAASMMRCFSATRRSGSRAASGPHPCRSSTAPMRRRCLTSQTS
jgi:uncharacterized protein involved in exopolysaccharide biosynthesis